MNMEVSSNQYIESIHLFQNLALLGDSMIDKNITLKTYERNQIIYNIGDTATEIYFVLSGRIKLANHSNNGKENIKSIIYEGDLFGEMGILDDEIYSTRRDFAQALEDDTLVCYVSYENMKKMMEEYPELNRRLIKKVSKRLKRTEHRLESIMFKDARTRLIDFIKDLARDMGKPIGHEVLVKHRLTHQEIASMTAISRQKVTTLLNELKQENLIHLERKSLLIRDLQVLK